MKTVKRNDNGEITHVLVGNEFVPKEKEAFYRLQEEEVQRLNAAAPELLEACKWAVKQFEILADKGQYPEHFLVTNGGSGFRILVDAINKAESAKQETPNQ